MVVEVSENLKGMDNFFSDVDDYTANVLGDSEGYMSYIRCPRASKRKSRKEIHPLPTIFPRDTVIIWPRCSGTTRHLGKVNRCVQLRSRFGATRIMSLAS